MFFVAVAIPALQAAATYRANDHSEIRFFGALFEMLPDKRGLVLDACSTNMMIRYKLLGEAAGLDIVTVAPEPDRVAELRRAGYQVFAFSQGRSELTKFGYEFAPEQLWDLPLADYLDVVPRGWIVAACVTPGAVAHVRTNRDGWKRLGVTADVLFERHARTG